MQTKLIKSNDLVIDLKNYQNIDRIELVTPQIESLILPKEANWKNFILKGNDQLELELDFKNFNQLKLIRIKEAFSLKILASSLQVIHLYDIANVSLNLEEISNQLVELSLDRCQLSTWPYSSSFPSLTRLSLRGNQIESFLLSKSHFPNLAMLDLENNPLSDESIQNLKNNFNLQFY